MRRTWRKRGELNGSKRAECAEINWRTGATVCEHSEVDRRSATVGERDVVRVRAGGFDGEMEAR